MVNIKKGVVACIVCGILF